MKIHLVGYSLNGLCNQFVSLQTVVAIAGLFPNETINLVWHSLSRSKTMIEIPQRHNHNQTDVSKISSILETSNPSIFDLVEFNYDNVVIQETDLYIQNRLNMNFGDFQKIFINCTDGKENIEKFSGCRQEYKFDPIRDNFLTQTLVPYCKVFFNRTREIDLAISKLVFKQPYVDLAKKIANYLGSYNGTHIRIMPDHHQYYQFSKKRLKEGLEKFDNQNLPIICSIDQFDNEFIKSTEHKLIYVEDIVLNNFAEDFKALPFHNEVVLGLISLLVMVYADDFVGTPSSTFSNTIHNLRNNIVDEKFKFYPGRGVSWDNYDVNALPYSWNGSGDGISWERDFKESKLNI